MNRKSIGLLLVGFIITIAIILFGKSYSNNKKEELLRQGAAQQQVVKVETKKEEDTKQAELNKKLEGFQANRGALSLIDYGTLVEQKKGSLKIAFYGDNVKSEKWTEKVKATFSEKIGSKKVELSQVYFPGYDSNKLTNENKVADLVAVNPEIVFFMLPVIGNQKIDISLENSNQAILANYQAIKEQLPESLVIAVTPTPSSSLSEKFNSRTLDYKSYTAEAEEMLMQNSIPVINLYGLYNEKLQAGGIDLASTLNADGLQLNDNGTSMTAELFNAQLEVPIDRKSVV